MPGIAWLVLGFLGYKLLSEGGLSKLFHVSYQSTGPSPLPSPTTTATAVSFPTATPAGLPAWPSGWKASSPVTSAQVERAQVLLPVMQMGQVKYEKGPGGTWEAYWKHKMGTKTGVTVHVPRQPVSDKVTV